MSRMNFKYNNVTRHFLISNKDWIPNHTTNRIIAQGAKYEPELGTEGEYGRPYFKIISWQK